MTKKSTNFPKLLVKKDIYKLFDINNLQLQTNEIDS